MTASSNTELAPHHPRAGSTPRSTSPRRRLVASLALVTPVAAFAADAPRIDTGDTALVLVSAGLVMLMTPGLAFFYGGLVRAKNAVHTMRAPRFHTYQELR